MAVTTCTVSGTIRDMNGAAIENVTIEASQTVPYFYGDGSLITPSVVTTLTNALGAWSLVLPENASTTTSTRITISYPDGAGGEVRRDYSIIVPNSSTANFATLAAGQ